MEWFSARETTFRGGKNFLLEVTLLRGNSFIAIKPGTN